MGARNDQNFVTLGALEFPKYFYIGEISVNTGFGPF